MKQHTTNSELYDMILQSKGLVWSPKSGLAKTGWKVVIPRTERLHRISNFTLHRLEEFLRYHRTTLSDFEYDYYLSASYLPGDIIALDICRVFEYKDQAAAYSREREGYIVENIESREG